MKNLFDKFKPTYVFHAAAYKHVPLVEHNPLAAIKTNILGAQNIIEMALEKGVNKVIALSTDKASAPINLYGATKLTSDKLFVAANNLTGSKSISFSVVRYGNVMGSRGSVIPLFKSLRSSGVLPITDPRMTRFMISLEHGVELVWHAFEDMIGGEVYVKKIPSMKVADIARVIAPNAKHKIVGIRPGEKLHEQMIGIEDAPFTYEYDEHFKILPSIHDWAKSEDRIKNGKLVAEDFVYASNTNSEWMVPADLQRWIDANRYEIGKI